MKLTNGDLAVIDPLKITGYCLSQQHEQGKHKAGLFREILGITLDNAHLLLDALRCAAAEGEAVAGKADQYGRRYTVDFVCRGPLGAATIRSAWIIRGGEKAPRFVTCYIL